VHARPAVITDGRSSHMRAESESESESESETRTVAVNLLGSGAFRFCGHAHFGAGDVPTR
jgi:hypothetical protein